MQIIANLGKNLLALRKQSGLTQESLASIAVVPRSTIAHMETGDANPSVSTLGKIAAGLQVTNEELLPFCAT